MPYLPILLTLWALLATAAAQLCQNVDNQFWSSATKSSRGKSNLWAPTGMKQMPMGSSKESGLHYQRKFDDDYSVMEKNEAAILVSDAVLELREKDKSKEYLSLCQTTPKNGESCPPNFIRLAGQCFHINTCELTFDAASSNCQGLGASLAYGLTAQIVEKLHVFLTVFEQSAPGTKFCGEEDPVTGEKVCMTFDPWQYSLVFGPTPGKETWLFSLLALMIVTVLPKIKKPRCSD